MTVQPNVSFAMKSWEEKPYNELPGELKMTRPMWPTLIRATSKVIARSII